jgi:hypothetical protein
MEPMIWTSQDNSVYMYDLIVWAIYIEMLCIITVLLSQ